MMRSEVVGLITKTFTEDDIGQRKAQETVVNVFAEISSIASAEFFRAGESGIRAEFVVRTPAINYGGQDEAELNGKRYVIYRTYTAGDNVELYLAERAGLNG